MIGRVLESEYPRLLRLFNECWTRLQHSLPSDMSAQLLDQELQAFKQGCVASSSSPLIEEGRTWSKFLL